MADPELWSELEKDTLAVLRESVRSLVDVEKDEIKQALAEIARDGARQAWLLVNGSADEKAQAPGNLRSLSAQAVIVAADTAVVASREAREAFVKVIETVGIFLLRNAPKLLAAI